MEKRKRNKKYLRNKEIPNYFIPASHLFEPRSGGDGNLVLFGALLKLDVEEALGAGGVTGAAGPVGAGSVVGACLVVRAASSFALTEVV